MPFRFAIAKVCVDRSTRFHGDQARSKHGTMTTESRVNESNLNRHSMHCASCTHTVAATSAGVLFCTVIHAVFGCQQRTLPFAKRCTMGNVCVCLIEFQIC